MTTEEFSKLTGQYVAGNVSRMDTKSAEKKARLQQKHDQSLYGVTAQDGQYWDDADSSSDYRLQGADAPEIYHEMTPTGDTKNVRSKVYQQVAYENQIPLEDAVRIVDQQAEARSIDQEYRQSPQFQIDKLNNPNDPYYQSQTLGEGIGLTGRNTGGLTSFDVYHAGDVATKAGREDIQAADWEKYKTGEKGYFGRELLNNPEYVNKMISEGYMVPGEADDPVEYAKQKELFDAAKEQKLGLHGHETVDPRVAQAMQQTSYAYSKSPEAKAERAKQAGIEYQKATQGWLEGAAKAAGTGFVKELAVDFADWVGDTTNMYDIGTEEEKTEMVNKLFNYVPATSQETVQQVEGLNNIAWDSNQDITTRLAAIGKSITLAAQDGEMLGSSLGVLAAWLIPGMALTKGHKVGKVMTKIDKGVDAGKLSRTKAAGMKTKKLLGTKEGIGYGLRQQSGMITGALGNINDQYETFVENNNGVELQGADKAEWFARSFGVQMFNQNLDAITAVSIMKSPGMLQAAKQSIKDVSEKAFGKAVVGMSVGVGKAIAQMPKEAAQEYTQGMMELYNERFGAEEFKDTDTFTKFITNPEFAKEKTVDALLGAGGSLQFSAMGAISQVAGKTKIAVDDKMSGMSKLTDEERQENDALSLDIAAAKDEYVKSLDANRFDETAQVIDFMEEKANALPNATQKKAANREIIKLRKALDDKIDAVLDSEDEIILGSEAQVKTVIQSGGRSGRLTDENIVRIREAAAKVGMDLKEFDSLVEDDKKLNSIIADYTTITDENKVTKKKEGVKLEVLYGAQGAYTYAKDMLQATRDNDQAKITSSYENLKRLVGGQETKSAALTNIKNKLIGNLATKDGGQKGVIQSIADAHGVDEETIARSFANYIGVNPKSDGATVTLSKKDMNRVFKTTTTKYAKAKATTGTDASNKGEWKSHSREGIKLFLEAKYPHLISEKEVKTIPLNGSIADIDNEVKLIDSLMTATSGTEQTAANAETETTTETPVDTEEELVDVEETAAVVDVEEEFVDVEETTPAVEEEIETVEESVVEEVVPERSFADRVKSLDVEELTELVGETEKGSPERSIALAAKDLAESFKALDNATTKEDVIAVKEVPAGKIAKLKEAGYTELATKAEGINDAKNTKIIALNKETEVKSKLAAAEKVKAKKEVTAKLAEQEEQLKANKEATKRINADIKAYGDRINDTWELLEELYSEKKAIKQELSNGKKVLARLAKLKNVAVEVLKSPTTKNLNRARLVLSKLGKELGELVSTLLSIVTKHEQHVQTQKIKIADAKSRLAKISTKIAQVKSSHELAKIGKEEARKQKQSKLDQKVKITQSIKDSKYRSKLLSDSVISERINDILEVKSKDSSLLGKLDITLVDNDKVNAITEKAVNLLSKVLQPLRTKNKIVSTASGKRTLTPKHQLDQMVKENPAAGLLYNQDGTVNANVATAIAMTVKEFIGTSSAELEQATDQDIATLIGKSAEDITAEDRAKFGGLGKQTKYLAKTLAGGILNNLGLKAKTETFREDYAQLEAGLGEYGVLLLEEMGYVQPNSIKVKDLKEALGEVTEEVGDETIPFTQLTDKYRKYGEAVEGLTSGISSTFTSDVEEEFVDYEQDTLVDFEGSIDTLIDIEESHDNAVDPIKNELVEFKEVQEVIGVEDALKYPRVNSTKGDREVTIRNNDVMSVPAKVQKTINKVENQEHNMLTVVVKNLIGDSESKDRARKVAQLKHALGWKPVAGSGSIANIVTREDLEGQKGKNMGIDKEVDMLVNYYDMVQSGTIDNAQFFDYFYSRNGRLMLDSNTINPQSGKQLHRFLFPPKNAIDVDTSVDSVMFKYAIAQSFGFAIDKSTGNEIVAFADAIMEAPTKDIRAAIETLMSGAKHTELAGQEIEIEFLGQMLVAEQSIIARAEAKRKKVANFKSSLMLETDAKTNGFGIKLRQFPRADMAWNKLWQKKTGMLLGWEAIKDADGKGTNEIFGEPGFQDSYQEIVDGVPEIDGVINDLKAKLISDELYNESSDPGMVKGLHDVVELLSMLSGTEFTPTMKKNGKITGAARNLAKGSFMNKNYGSGYLSTKRTTGAAMTDGMLSNFVQYVRTGKKVGDISTKDLEKLSEMIMKLVNTNSTNKDMTREEVATMLTQNGASSIRVKLMYKAQTKKKGALVKAADETKEYNLEKGLQLVFADTYGESINSQLKDMMGEFDESNKHINNSFKIMYRLFAERFETTLNEHIAKHGGISKEDYLKLVRGMLATFPKVKGPMSEDHENFTDYISIFNEELLKQLEQKAIVQIEKDGNPSSRQVQAIVKMITEAGSAGAVIPIHTFDGSMMSELLAKHEFTNVFDAIVASPDKISEIVKDYNEMMVEANKEWNFFSEVSKALDSAIAAAGNDVVTKLSEVNANESDYSKKISESKGKQEITDLQQLAGIVSDAAKVNQTNKIAMEELPVVSGHMVLNGGAQYTDSPTFNTKEDTTNESILGSEPVKAVRKVESDIMSNNKLIDNAVDNLRKCKG
jgi:hypothetical protein